MEPATLEQIANWDELVAANPDGGNVLQLQAFGESKGRHGWLPKHFMLGNTAVLILERSIPLLGKYWYVPKGPGVGDRGGLKVFAEKVAKLPTGERPFATKIDPEISRDSIKTAELTKLGFIEAPRDIQYNVATVLVDLKPSEEEILSAFKQKTRYNIRLAAKKGVVVEAVPTNDETMAIMYRLAAETYQRAGVYTRSQSYFADFWRLHAGSGRGQMFFACYEGQVLAAAFITFVAKKALYKDGASSREHSAVQAPYGLQWSVMRWLKEQGVTEYDLHGTPPADRIEDSSHPLAGLARFKTGFQPNVTQYIGTFDLPLDKSKYDTWRRYGERLATAYEYRVKKRLFY